MTIEQYKALPIDELVDTLILADDQYSNDGESFLSDEEYDEIRRHLELTMPNHPYLSTVGSAVRGEKVELPAQMGGMKQVHQGKLLSWIEDNNVAEEEVGLGDKMDGLSDLLVFGKGGSFMSAFSRGDGDEAADVTRHILKLPSAPKNVSAPMMVRGEVIMKKENFEAAKKIIKKSDGSDYKTIRGIVAGVFNSEKKPDAIYPLIDFVAFKIVNSKLSKREQQDLLVKEGFQVAHTTYTTLNKITEEKLTAYLAKRRIESPYMLDGIVGDIVNAEISKKMNNAMREGSQEELSSFKFKVNDKEAITTCIEVEWNDSKHGIPKPTVIYNAVTLGNITASRATGVSAQNIIDQGIGPGAKLKIVLSGDVIPNISEVLEKVEPQMPKGDYVWIINLDGEQGVDLILKDAADNVQVLSKQMTDFFSKLNTPNLKDGSIIKLVDAGFDTIEKVINANKSELVSVMGVNGAKAYDGLHAKLAAVQLYELMGATVIFGRSMGERKFKNLQKGLGVDGILALSEQDEDVVRGVPGFKETAKLVVGNMSAFLDFMKAIETKLTIADDNTKLSGGLPLDGQKIVFTGFRDKSLEEQVISLGAEMSDSVSKKTSLVVADDPDSNSGKAKKAKDIGVEVIDKPTFIARLSLLQDSEMEEDEEIEMAMN